MTEHCIITAFTFCTTLIINDIEIILSVMFFFQGGTLGGKKKDRDKKSVIDIFHKKKVSSISWCAFSYSV